jgi:NAD(P)H-hydrate epimerase
MTTDLPTLPRRPEAGHKGTFGTVCVVGGQADPPRVMLGGPAFAALGALRAGCGLAMLAVPAPIVNACLQIAPSATGLALPVDAKGQLKPSLIAQMLDAHAHLWECMAIGPGFGAGEYQQQVVVRLISQDDKPLVIDADGINALAALRDFHADLQAPTILTPHPGEYRRLAAALGIDADPVDEAKRPDAAARLAGQIGCVVVLKGHRTVVSDGVNTVTNDTGGPALATAGTGDVLTGVIAGFVAQFFRRSLGTGERQVTAQQQGGLSLLDCARLAVWVHGRAADLWTERHGAAGMLAADLLELIPSVISELRGG